MAAKRGTGGHLKKSELFPSLSEHSPIILISACLVGVPCRYDGQSSLLSPSASFDLLNRTRLILVCPEHLGGLPTPRPRNEIQGGTGVDVLEGRIKVMNENGEDVTAQFCRGAEIVLKIAKCLGINVAVLKSKSPSCGCGKIYDGSFQGHLIPGDGVTTALLRLHGIKVFTEKAVQKIALH